MKYEYKIKHGFTIRFNDWLDETWAGFDSWEEANEAMNEVLENVKKDEGEYIWADVRTYMIVVRP